MTAATDNGVFLGLGAALLMAGASAVRRGSAARYPVPRPRDEAHLARRRQSRHRALGRVKHALYLIDQLQVQVDPHNVVWLLEEAADGKAPHADAVTYALADLRRAWEQADVEDQARLEVIAGAIRDSAYALQPLDWMDEP